MRSDPTRRLRFLALTLLLAVPACTTSDTQLFDEVGVTRLFMTDPALVNQALVDAGDRIQVAEWTLERADIEVDGQVLDLLNGQSCRVVDTVLTVSTAVGSCSSGRVLEASETPRPLRLSLAFIMKLRRARPADLPPNADADMDGLPNAEDSCPLVSNPLQEDDDMDGIGDACSVDDPFLRMPALDSDADEVADVLDNCVPVANPTQADTSGVTTEGFPDLIGDACTEQVVQVHLKGDLAIRLDLGPVDLVQMQNQVAFLTVDFGNPGALNCNWDFGVCDLDADRVSMCIASNLLTASVGCPP